MSTQELHLEPMTTGMVLDRSFRLYAQNFALMIGLTAIVHVPILFISVGIPFLAERGTLLGIVGALLAGLVGLASLLIVGPLVTGAATKAISDRYLGHSVTAADALKYAWGYIGTLLLTQIVVGLIVFGGILLLIVPGILWALSYSLTAPVAVLEDTADRAEIRRRSWELVKGNRGKVFVVMAVIVIAQLLVSGAGLLFIYSVYDLTSTTGQVLQAICESIAGILTYPLQAIAITLLYYDFRIRKEGFDLEVLSRAIGNPSPSA